MQSQLFISLLNRYHQWLSAVELIQISVFSASYSRINPCFTAGKQIRVWNCHATRGHRKRTISHLECLQTRSLCACMCVWMLSIFFKNLLFKFKVKTERGTSVEDYGTADVMMKGQNLKWKRGIKLSASCLLRRYCICGTPSVIVIACISTCQRPQMTLSRFEVKRRYSRTRNYICNKSRSPRNRLSLGQCAQPWEGTHSSRYQSSRYDENMSIFVVI